MPAPVAPDPAATGEDPARELGRRITAAREAAGKSIEDVADATRIRGSLIRSMEAGDFAPCGGHVYARGHLRSIAGTIGADAAPLLAGYDALAGSPPAPTATPFAAPASVTPEPDSLGLRDLSGRSGRARPSTWLIAAVGAALVIAVIAGVSVAQSGGGGSAPTAQPGAGTSVSHAPSTHTPPTSPPETVALAGVNVNVQVHDSSSWVHVADETGALVFQGTMTPGQTKLFHAAQELKFVFGYAPAINLTVNGRSVGQPPAGAGDVSTETFDASNDGGANG
jgi:cytoskeleton protein RodZ